jgi:hypothetical protein
MSFSWPPVLKWYVDFGRTEVGTGGTAVKKEPDAEPLDPPEAALKEL